MRDYSSGDWFAVPLGEGRFAEVLVVRCAPRVAAAHVFSEAGELLWSARVYDRPIRERRWAHVRAPRRTDFTSLALPNGHALDPRIFEATILKLVAGETFVRPRVSVCDVRPPLDPARLQSLPQDAVVQWRRRLSPGDLQIVARAVEERPQTTVRLYGAASSQIDAAGAAIAASRWQVDTQALLAQRQPLERACVLAIDGSPSDLTRFPNVETLVLQLHGAALDATVLAGTPRLRSLRISGGTLIAASALPAQLQKLDLADVRIDEIDAVMQLPQLRALRLKRVAPVPSLRSLSEHPHLRYLALEDLTYVDDLRPLVRIPALESLELTGAWQFGVGDLALVTEMPALQRLRVDIGGLRKNAPVCDAPALRCAYVLRTVKDCGVQRWPPNLSSVTTKGALLSL